LALSSTEFTSQEKEHVPSWIEGLLRKDLQAITKMFSENNPEDIPFSNLDLFSLDGFTARSVRKRLFDFIGLNDSKNGAKKAITKINTLYKSALEYLED
jgi:hypothetical protein